MTVAVKSGHQNCTHSVCSYERSRQYDPTHTIVLRNAFAGQMGKRFRKIRGLVRGAILERDCFGMREATMPRIRVFQLPQPKAFDFPRSQDKITAFMEWLNEQVSLGVLETYEATQLGEAVEEAWTNVYIEQGYRAGVIRGRKELLAAGFVGVPAVETITGELWGIFGSPMHVDRAGILYTRTFTDLKGITDAMDSQISRILADGIARGLGPDELARRLVRTISGPDGDLGITDVLKRRISPERRAKMLARTEIIRAHHQATIQEYRNWGVVGVKIKAEWKTAGFNVCPECLALEGRIFSLDQIESMIPLHPNCRCVALPVDVTTYQRRVA